ncbi:GLOBIN domain-containing protein [Caerostris darwini]|uniref:GLOBIN domain-containing protein n=1 Tax=Caerostris darwini TaxID=1538125 RepID=A0AAV4QXQ9_9ARAC|nr:GLOBIN domain-containing protein [Caerostris darwini]
MEDDCKTIDFQTDSNDKLTFHTNSQVNQHNSHLSLFETHPDVQDVFMPFKGMSPDELRHSKELRAHGLRVMGFVQKVVARFEEPDKSEVLLKELGKNHVMYGAKVDYVDVSTTAHSLTPFPLRDAPSCTALAY